MPSQPLPPCPQPRRAPSAHQRLVRHASTAAAVLATAVLAACGGGGGGGPVFIPPIVTPPSPPPPPPPPPPSSRGTLVEPAQSVASFTAKEFGTLLDLDDKGQALALIAGTPKCGFELQSVHYHTVGGKEEETTASAALMVPTGSDPACTGPRPIVMYAHGTTTDRAYDLSRWVNPEQSSAAEGVILAAMFAAQGYIVVAPNYAGYAQSKLPYHPYLNGTQQGRDVADSLKAARSVLPLAGASDSGALLLTGYSQGGYVALAAHRELQAMGQSVTASAPLSAPSAISLLTDYNFLGWPALGSTIFVPLLSTSWQQQFGDVYNSPDLIYESQYAQGIESLLPSLTPIGDLIAAGKLPLTALYPANAVPGPLTPELGIFYGANNLIRQSYLTAAVNDLQARPCPGNALPPSAGSLANPAALDCQPDNGLRRAAVANDLRNWLPTRPVFFCGGADDPTVNFLSTQATAGYFAARGMPQNMLQVLDLEAGNSGEGDPYAAARAGFAQAKADRYNSTEGDAAVKAEAVIRAYHGTLVPPFCVASARGFFQGVLAGGG
ncbi:prolyl oligopeptidase family serine peptidase [Xenophilus arseniciresistens]|uniref:Prolyl oligopeptidase family serine peptidase n=1 Tax=Xenophilus arseniciresistens TaxID=1283306 RepID=A0AAE3NC29_9BURK|nr:lipase family protein [Xenophilus arseniciresistens]MDA7418453.1 prolyl oligopeptidase family serine peptidase [Xenophilus arseniciresistens]